MQAEQPPSDDGRDGETARDNRSFNVIITLLLVLVLIALFYSMIPNGKPTAYAVVNREKHIGKNVALACRSYAADWEGRFPESLEILYPDYLDDRLFFDDEKGGSKWVYVPGLTEGSTPGTALFWSREKVKDRAYVVARLTEGGGVWVELEETAPAPGGRRD